MIHLLPLLGVALFCLGAGVAVIILTVDDAITRDKPKGPQGLFADRPLSLHAASPSPSTSLNHASRLMRLIKISCRK